MKKAYFLFSILLSFVLTIIFFRDLKGNEFIFIHDEFLALSKSEIATTFFTHNLRDLGIANTTVMIVTLFDRLFYYVMYGLNMNLFWVERLMYFIKLVLLTLVPYWGFKKLSRLYAPKLSEYALYLISLFYAFNTFTMIYWNGNAFSLTLLVCYILAPLTLYLYHRAVFNNENLSRVNCVLALFFMSFALYFFVVYLIVLLIYTVIYLFLEKKDLLNRLKNLLLMALLYLPFLSLYYLIFYEMFISTNSTINQVGGDTYSTLQGAFLYQFFMWYSWGIYTYWEPKAIFTFQNYYKTFLPILAPIALYALLIWNLTKKLYSKSLISLMVTFLILLLFVKGSQPPFDQLYTFLIHHFAPFRLFRSPDAKFGFGLVFVTSVMLMIVGANYKKTFFSLLLSAILLIQALPIITGVAIRGQNSPVSVDRIIHQGTDYQTLADFINRDPNEGYVLAIPSVSFGHFDLDVNEKHIGQDLLAKIINKPMIDASEFSGMTVQAYKKLTTAMSKGDITTISQFPIRYFILRSDTDSDKNDLELQNEVRDKYKRVFHNRTFEVYSNALFSPIISGDNVIISSIDPIEYKIHIKNSSQKIDIRLNQNFNPDWKLFIDRPSLFPTSLKLIFQKPVAQDSHKLYNGYANNWTVSKEELKNMFPDSSYIVNLDGSLDLNLILYFTKQSVFSIGVVISSIYFILLTSISLYSSVFRNKND